MPTPAHDLLDPRNDLVFKKLFERSADLLCDLINAVRAGQPPVDSIQILNPGIPPEAIQGKAIVLDILACDRTGRRFNIEMQVQQHQAVPLRLVFYLARVTGGQLQAGEEYASLKPVVGIYLLDFTLMHNWSDQAVWTFELRDRWRPDVRLPDTPFELNLIELPKADHLGQNVGMPAEDTPSKALSAWIAFFKHAKEPAVMSQIEHQPVREAHATLQHISQDELTQLQALARERALMDQRAMIGEARAEGKIEGKIEGRAELLVRLLTLRFGQLPAGTAERVHAGTEADHIRWTERVLTAPSLDAVLD